MSTKKETKEDSVEEVPATGLAKADLEHVNLNDKANEERAFPEPKVVNYDNGTQSFEDTTEAQKVTHPEIVQGAYSSDNTAPKDVYVDNIETPAVIREKRVIQESLTKAQFQAFMDKEKAERPQVYKDREEDYKKQLEAIKS